MLFSAATSWVAAAAIAKTEMKLRIFDGVGGRRIKIKVDNRKE
jgi:hypothetical protein